MESRSTRKQGDRANSKIVIVVIGLCLLVLLILTHDIILTHIFAYKICRADPKPKMLIARTVSFPESIYWKDNVYPGFDEKSRLLMIRNYLDGVCLKSMALNTPDGSICFYTAIAKDWKGSKDIKARKQKGDYIKTVDVCVFFAKIKMMRS